MEGYFSDLFGVGSRASARLRPAESDWGRFVSLKHRAPKEVNHARFSAADQIQLAITVPIHGFQAGLVVAERNLAAITPEQFAAESRPGVTAYVAIQHDDALLIGQNVQIPVAVPVGHFKAVMIGNRRAELRTILQMQNLRLAQPQDASRVALAEKAADGNVG